MTDVWFELLPENVQKLFLKEVEALECNAFKTPYEKRKKDEANSDQNNIFKEGHFQFQWSDSFETPLKASAPAHSEEKPKFKIPLTPIRTSLHNTKTSETAKSTTSSDVKSVDKIMASVSTQTDNYSYEKAEVRAVDLKQKDNCNYVETKEPRQVADSPVAGFGFKTAGGKKTLAPSKEAMEKAKQSLQIGPDEFEGIAKTETIPIKNQTETAKSSSGFQTAGGRKVEITNAESLAKAKKLLEVQEDNNLFEFHDDVHETVRDSHEKKNLKEQNVTATSGFQTAAGKKMKPLSNEAIERAKKLLDIDEGEVMLDDPRPSPPKPVKMVGFGAASGKKLLAPSKEALEKAKRLLGSDGEADKTEQAPMGFKTAGTGRIKPLSTEALVKAKKLLEDDDDNTEKESCSKDFAKPGQMFGFGAASGKKLLAPSKEALEKAKQMMDLDSEFNKIESNLKVTALEKPKQVVREGSDDSSSKPQAHSIKTQSKSFGFGSASGKKLPSPTREALEKAQKRMEEENTVISQSVKESHLEVTAGYLENRRDQHMIQNDLRPRMNNEPRNVNSGNSDKRCLEQTNFDMPPPSKIIRVQEPVRKNADRRKTMPAVPQERKPNAAKRQNTSTKRQSMPPKKAPVVYEKVVMEPKAKIVPLFDTKNVPTNRISYRQLEDDFSSDYYFERQPQQVINMTFDSAKEYKIDGQWSAEDALKDLESLGARIDLIGPEWVANHYAFIIWKLASTLRRFPSKLTFENFSKEHIVAQLRYRYEVEIVQGRRSCLKAVAEKDDTPSRPIVLFVVKKQNSKDEFIVSDGWYCFNALFDKTLSQAYDNGKLAIGSKFYSFGAQLLHADACPPLELPPSSMIRFQANSCRRVPWDTKLGFSRKTPFKSLFKDIKLDGGIVPRLEVVITKTYPVCYMEITNDGERNVRHMLEDFQFEGQEKPNIRAFMKFRVMDQNGDTAIICYWNPSEDLRYQVKIGKYMEIYNLAPGRSEIYSLSLSSSRSTSWRIIKQPWLIDIPTEAPLTCTDISAPNVSYGEVDVIACILSVVDSTVFLCDENESLAAVTLFGKRFKEKSFSRIVKEGNVVFFSNIWFESYDHKFGLPVFKTVDETKISLKIIGKVEALAKNLSSLKATDRFDSMKRRIQDRLQAF